MRLRSWWVKARYSTNAILPGFSVTQFSFLNDQPTFSFDKLKNCLFDYELRIYIRYGRDMYFFDIGNFRQVDDAFHNGYNVLYGNSSTVICLNRFIRPILERNFCSQFSWIHASNGDAYIYLNPSVLRFK